MQDNKQTLTPVQVRHYIRALHKGTPKEKKAAREKLVKYNQNLVHFIVKKYDFLPGITQDLISAGNIGLLHAINKYDPSRKTAFSTYAYEWISRDIRRALTNEYRFFKVSEQLLQLMQRHQKVISSFFMQKGRNPTQEEIAKELNISLKKVQSIHTILELVRVPNEHPNEENGPDKSDSIASKKPSEIQAFLYRDFIERLFARIQQREKRGNPEVWFTVLKLHFGIEDGTPYSSLEIAKKLGLSRQRIHQIIQNSIQKLQNEYREVKK
jgi:RNA polymerase primary sigma factor